MKPFESELGLVEADPVGVVTFAVKVTDDARS